MVLFGFLNLVGLAVLPEGNAKMLFGVFVFVAFYGFSIFYTYFLLNDSYQFTLLGMLILFSNVLH